MPLSLSFKITLLILLTQFGLYACTNGDPSQQEEPVIALTGATLIDGTGKPAITGSVILTEGDRITCVGTTDDCSIPADAKVIDLSGSFVTPGMVDAHMHFFQTGFFDSRPDAMDITDTYPFPEVAAYQKMHPERYYRSYLCSGVTGVYDVGGMTWSIDLQQHAENDPMAPLVAAAGPLITPAPGAPFDLPSDRVLVPLNSTEAGVKTVQYLSELGSTGIKFWQLNADNEEYMARVAAAAEEIRKRGNQMIAHATTLSQAKAALRNGSRLLVHSVGDTEIDQEFIDLALQNGTYYNPTLIVSTGYLMAFRAAADIQALPYSDPNGCVDPKTMELINNASQFSDHPRLSAGMMARLNNFDPETDRVSPIEAKNLMSVYEAGIPVVVGTDAGNPGTLHGVSIFDEMEAMQDAGIPASDLIVMATKNGAESMRRSEDLGTVEAGKLASLLIMDNDPSRDISNMRSITHVMNKGALYRIEELSAHQ